MAHLVHQEDGEDGGEEKHQPKQATPQVGGDSQLTEYRHRVVPTSTEGDSTQ